ncbi:MAG: hypothetical protein ACK52U_16180 [Synechococcaceae cyanobacterium]
MGLKGYALYWRNNGSGAVVRWDLGRDGVFQSASPLSASALMQEEAGLQFDLNGDGSIGVRVGTTADGYALFSAGQAPLPVVFAGGIASPENPGNSWVALAATVSDRGYFLYWGNSLTHEVVRWDLDRSGASEQGWPIHPVNREYLEARLGVDLNLDGYRTGPYGNIYLADPLGTRAINVGLTSRGYALRPGPSDPIQITYPKGNASLTNPGNDWKAVAARSNSNGFDLYWRNEQDGRMALWKLDNNGAYQSCALAPAGSQLVASEVSMNSDLNGDGITGYGFGSYIGHLMGAVIDSQGDYTLYATADGMARVDPLHDWSITRFDVTSPFNLGVGELSTEWQMLAAENVNGQNQILWRNNLGNFLHLWNLNSAWQWQSSHDMINPLSAEALGLERSFQVDLNGNGIIG